MGDEASWPAGVNAAPEQIRSVTWSELAARLAQFRDALIAHRELFRQSLNRTIPDRPIANADALRDQQRDLSRQLYVLDPYLTRFTKGRLMHHRASGNTWDIYRAAVGNDTALIKGPSMDNAILEIEGIIALLETMPPHNEIDVKSGAVPLASAEGTLRPDPRKVFVVHGRNEPARRAMFAFLRSIRLEPIEWIQAVSQTASGSPHIGEILDHAFSQAQAVVVLLTGDDVARLAARFMRPGDPVHERELTPQARPNVLFEAGMAFGRQPTRTILVTLGPVRPFSDIAGRHLIVMDDSVAKRQALATRLADVGCAASITHGTDWHTEGQFEAAIRPSSEYEEALALDAGPHRTSSALLALSRGSKSLDEVNSQIPPHDLTWTRDLLRGLLERSLVQMSPASSGHYELTDLGQRVTRALDEIPPDVRAKARQEIWDPHD